MSGTTDPLHPGGEPASDPASTWHALREAGLVQRLAAGDTLFHQGDEADGAYVVLAGRCAVLEGDEHVSLLLPGELFGEIAALGGGRRTATVVAIDDSELLFLSIDDLRTGFASSPEVLWQALRLVVERLGRVAHRQMVYRDEHKALRKVQASLLPDLTPYNESADFRIEAVWRPCTYASGDYYDVIPVDGHRYLFAVGDVMGHGAEASLMMAIARAQIRELARHFRRTDELLLRLDGYLRDNAPPKQGMSLVVAALDTRERVLEYSIAGHPFPLLARGGTVGPLDGRPGILLALPFLLGTGYERREVELHSGDRLLLFTDGLFELPVDEAGTHLGLDGLARELLASLDAPSPLTQLMHRIDDLDASEQPDDDRTALLLELP